MKKTSDVMTATLEQSRQGQVLILTIANAEHRNALGPEIYAEGMRALITAKEDKGISCVVIVGEGSMFSAGGNLQRLQANRQQPPSVQAQSIDGLHTWIEAIGALPKPVIAAVEGAAAGAGFSLALSCDFIVAASDAVFVMAYSNIALSPDGGGSWRLTHALPRQLVNELLMCGERITAQRLNDLGIVNRVTTPGSALTDALELGNRLCGRAANALASVKTLVQQAHHNTLPDHLKQERDHFVANLHHANAGAGISAFLLKQRPRYE
jgi:enoyl-CoA hydratase/carnithine racemase